MKSIIVVGAGIAGLATGVYGQVNGYRTRIFEQHDKPGGLCTSWRRGDYVFDGCLHWLVGTSAASPMNRIWRELGALPGPRVVDHEELVRVETGGRTLVVHTDADRFEEHLKGLSPFDTPWIRRFCADVRTLARLSRAPDPVERPWARKALRRALQVAAVAPVLVRWSGISVQRMAERLSDRFLRESLPLVFELPDFPVIAMLFTLAWMHGRDAGYPVGGSLELARRIERRYRDLGGDVGYGSAVERILVEDDRAVGVRLADGSEHRADWVVSAADGHATLFAMLAGRHAGRRLERLYRELPLFPSLVQVSLGVARDLSSEPPAVSFPLDPPIRIAGEDHGRLSMRHFCYDPTVAPQGRSVIVVTLGSSYDAWKSYDAARYAREKRDAADAVIAALERRLPGLPAQVEVVDVATPLTYERTTRNWRGSMEGWLLTTRTLPLMARGLGHELPGLRGFRMAGQWVHPGGGVPTAASCGREVVRAICRADRRRFATEPSQPQAPAG